MEPEQSRSPQSRMFASGPTRTFYFTNRNFAIDACLGTLLRTFRPLCTSGKQDEVPFQEDEMQRHVSTARVREADPSDNDFLFDLSPRLSGVPRPAWHTLNAMEQFQSRFMAATLDNATEGSQTLIAISQNDMRLGYIHMQPGKDGVTN